MIASRAILALVALGLTSCAGTSTDHASNASQETVKPSKSCAARLAGNSVEITFVVETDSGREVPLTVFMPEKAGVYPVAAFSHGAYASPTRYRKMLAPLAGAGYIIIAPMHVDSEEFGSQETPSRAVTWTTRNEDFALALTPPAVLLESLAASGYSVDTGKTAALGHSYGALIAHLAGGAIANEPDGSVMSHRNDQVDLVVGWSPPGPFPGMMEAEGWSTLAKPTLTITGTNDILPGFIDDWRDHAAAYDFGPLGYRALWVGDGIDHYFGGMFGREKPADENSIKLFQRALEVSLNFMDRKIGKDSACTLEPSFAGEQYQEDEA